MKINCQFQVLVAPHKDSPKVCKVHIWAAALYTVLGKINMYTHSIKSISRFKGTSVTLKYDMYQVPFGRWVFYWVQYTVYGAIALGYYWTKSVYRCAHKNAIWRVHNEILQAYRVIVCMLLWSMLGVFVHVPCLRMMCMETLGRRYTVDRKFSLTSTVLNVNSLWQYLSSFDL